MRAVARSGRADRRPHQLPLVAPDGMRFRIPFTRIPYDWFGELTPEMLAYAARDILYLHDLREALLAKVEEKAPHLKPVVDLEHRMAKVTAHMSAVGMPVDEAVFAECVRESREAATRKLAELDALVVTALVPEDYQKKNTKNKKVPEDRHDKVNWDSPQQVLWAFKEVAGLTLPNTSKETLPEVDHPWPSPSWSTGRPWMSTSASGRPRW